MGRGHESTTSEFIRLNSYISNLGIKETVKLLLLNHTRDPAELVEAVIGEVEHNPQELINLKKRTDERFSRSIIVRKKSAQ